MVQGYAEETEAEMWTRARRDWKERVVGPYVLVPARDNETKALDKCSECNGTGWRECHEEAGGHGGFGGITECECGATPEQRPTSAQTSGDAKRPGTP